MKKIFFGGAALMALSLVLVGPQAWYHVKSAFRWAREEVRDAVPIGYRLEQAEDMIQDLGPEIEGCHRRVAEEEVELEYLTREIESLEGRVANEAQVLKARRDSLETEQVSFRVAGRPYSREALLQRLALAFEHHKQNLGLLESKKQLLEAQSQSVTAARRRLDATLVKKQRLEIMVQELRAQHLETQALQAGSERFAFDDSKLADVEEVLQRCKKDLDVTQRMLIRDGVDTVACLPVADNTAELLVEMDAYFQGQPRSEVRELQPVR